MRYIFGFDRNKCVACGACVVACMDQHDTDLSAGEVPYRKVEIKDTEKAGRTETVYTSIGCMHCKNAPCVAACPVGCLTKNDIGLTVYDREKCIGCRRCEKACPFGAVFFGPDGKISKCDGCEERLRAGLEPACVRVCQTGAITCTAEE